MTTDKKINNSIWTDYLKENPIKKTDKFSIGVLSYPSDLGSEEFKHHIQFQINVRGKSNFNKDNRSKIAQQRNPNSANMSANELAEATETGAQLAAGIVTAAIAKKIFKIIPGTGSMSNVMTSAAAIGVGIGTAPIVEQAISGHKLLKPDQSYRISDSINLYVDGPPTVSYGMNYANKELGSMAGILSKSIVNTVKTEGASSEIAAAFGAAMAKLPGAFGSMDLQSVLSASSKTALNPFKEVLFESVDFRSFAFRYKFMPKSKAESETVKKIINLFKFHQHPELSDNKLFFIYPSEFVISYHYEGRDNKYFHKMAPCVLEKCEVTYGGENFATFEDGNPIEVNMSLIFRETEILTKSMLEKDHY